jgi:O-antigen/teichoic acid export membrane protein
MIEMLSNIASETILIQAEDGDHKELQETVQFFRASRGAVNGLILFVLAAPFARLFGVPQATWAFRSLGILPLCRGFFHLDVNRLQRHLRFAPSAITDAGSSWFATLITVPLAFWFRDYTAMLWALVIQVAAATFLSHILAERRYRWALNRIQWKRIVSFGWPLMINGILMVGIFEGDRFIIGSSERLFHRSSYTLSDLGVYSVTFAITMAPTLFIANISSSLFLPLLSRVQSMAYQFERRYLACFQAVCLAAAVISVLFIIAGGKLVTMIYGPRYAVAATVIGWLSAMWAIRVIRVAPTLAAIALGDTKNMMLSNCARALALVGMATAAGMGAGLVWIAISGVGGELLALATSLCRLYRKNAISPVLCAKPIAVVAAGMVMSMFFAPGPGAGLAVTFGAWLGCTILVITATLTVFQSLRNDIWFLLFKSKAQVAVVT